MGMGERTLQARLDEQCVINASEQFWEQMLAMTLETLPISGEFCVGAGHMLGTVTLSGVWKGRIEVRMAKGLAHRATASMLMQPVETVNAADTLDATKEIANMIAGVIKSSLPRPCTMNVPEAAVEAKVYCSRPRTEDTLAVAFRHTTGDLMVSIWEQECLESRQG
jgi:CheY-specific phosphatase CheX